MKADGHLAAGHERGHRDSRTCLHEPLLHVPGDAPSLEEREQVIAAWSGRIADAGRGQNRLPDGVLGLDRRARLAGPNGDGHRRCHQVDAAAGEHVALRDQLLDRAGGQHHAIERFSGGDSLCRFDASHRYDGDIRIRRAAENAATRSVSRWRVAIDETIRTTIF